MRARGRGREPVLYDLTIGPLRFPAVGVVEEEAAAPDGSDGLRFDLAHSRALRALARLASRRYP